MYNCFELIKDVYKNLHKTSPFATDEKNNGDEIVDFMEKNTNNKIFYQL